MRCLLLTQFLEPTTGYGRYSREVSLCLAAAGHEVVCLTDEHSPHNNPIPQVRVFPILKSFPNNGRKRLRLWRDALSARRWGRWADVIHALVEPYAPLAAKLAVRRPFFLSAIGSYIHQPFTIGGWCAKAHSRAFTDATGVLAISEFTRRQVERSVPSARILLWNLGVDTTHFSPPAHHLHRNAEDDFRILSVGAIKERKGYDITLDAFSRLAAKIPRAQYHIVGATHQKYCADALRSEVERRGLADRVFFHGEVSESALLSLYQSSDLFWLTPKQAGERFEGYGLVFLEAMACGLPCLTQKGSGAEEAVAPTGNGLWVVESGDAAALAERAIAMASASKDERIAWSRSVRQHAEAQSWQRTIATLLRFYESPIAIF